MPSMWDKLKPYTIELLRIAWNNAADDGIVSGSFDLDNPEVQKVLKDIAKRIDGIDDTTRDAVRAIIGQTELSVVEKRALLQELIGGSAARAEMIAATETADATERGNHLAWRASGVVDRKEWALGPEPCEICQPLGGKTVGLDDEFVPGVPHPPLHPSCTCATIPVLK